MRTRVVSPAAGPFKRTLIVPGVVPLKRTLRNRIGRSVEQVRGDERRARRLERGVLDRRGDAPERLGDGEGERRRRERARGRVRKPRRRDAEVRRRQNDGAGRRRERRPVAGERRAEPRERAPRGGGASRRSGGPPRERAPRGVRVLFRAKNALIRSCFGKPFEVVKFVFGVVFERVERDAEARRSARRSANGRTAPSPPRRAAAYSVSESASEFDESADDSGIISESVDSGISSEWVA